MLGIRIKAIQICKVARASFKSSFITARVVDIHALARLQISRARMYTHNLNKFARRKTALFRVF